MYIPLLGMDVYSGMCFMFSECHGVSRHETVFQQPLLVDHTQIYFASSLQLVLRGACRRRRRKKFISPTHEYFAVVLVKKNTVASNVGEEPFVPWRHCFLCEGREGGNGHAMLNSLELANLTSSLTPTPALSLATTPHTPTPTLSPFYLHPDPNSEALP